MPSCAPGHSDRGQLHLLPPRQGKPQRSPLYMLLWQSLNQVLFPVTRSNDPMSAQRPNRDFQGIL
ncbi:hypothetical protein A6R68_11505 [Neotoma lepida]|uniref:Uncharacterized protein n=1 Tax=Neotoma lepida TaxID=56216 RepID=A0A1A6FUW8_NEOLE|nr:hypothetical protein A6R68_11505 [Neotoma lepida]